MTYTAAIGKPVVYLAGKIAPHDWREKLVGYDIALNTGDERQLFDPCYRVERPSYIYGGPFYVACDHCCAHGIANHGVGASGDSAGCMTEWWGDRHSTPRRVFEVNRRRIANANIIFAFIDRTDCYGTLIELGIAAELGKRVAVVLGANLSANDIRELWMARMCATAGLYVGWPLERAWHALLNSADVTPSCAPRLVS